MQDTPWVATFLALAVLATACSERADQVAPGTTAKPASVEARAQDQVAPVATPSPSGSRPEPPVYAPLGVRMGREVDSTGRVPDAQQTDVFMWNDAIHIELAGASPGSTVLVAVRSADAGSNAWSRETSVPSGGPLSLSLDPGTLDPGRYQVQVYVGDARLAAHDFAVSGGEGGTEPGR